MSDSILLEYETDSGIIPEYLIHKHKLVPCRDGSVTGFEYVTIPHNGEEGLLYLIRNCQILKKHCSISPRDALHLHLGNYPITKADIASLFLTCKMLQNSIYKMFPLYQASTEHFKNRNYCSPLPPIGRSDTDTIETVFNKIYEYLSGGTRSFDKFGHPNHPMDESGRHKWYISIRYLWANLIPLIWGTTKTVEFRVHTPTFNPNKILNWIAITMGILEYSRRYKSSIITNKIKRLKLSTVIQEIYGNSKECSVLINYIRHRVDTFKDGKDSIGEQEIISDEIKKEHCFLV